MAQTALLTLVLLLLLNVKGTESSVVEQRSVEIDCQSMALDYRRISMSVFATECAPPQWGEFFRHPQVKSALDGMNARLMAATSGIEPPMRLVFEALTRVAPSEVKVVILGQDPAPQPGQATGLAFSVPNPSIVRSVQHVLLEVALEGWKVNLDNGDLSLWAQQGVLLLNAALTVERGKPGSHKTLWKPFTKLLVQYISEKADQSVWILWGAEAQKLKSDIHSVGTNKHYVLTGQHPSPSNPHSAMFFNGKYFQCANQFLQEKKRGVIDWSLAREIVQCPIQEQGPEPMELMEYDQINSVKKT